MTKMLNDEEFGPKLFLLKKTYMTNLKNFVALLKEALLHVLISDLIKFVFEN